MQNRKIIKRIATKMTMTQRQAVVIWKSRQKTVLKFELKWKLKQAGTWQTKLRYWFEKQTEMHPNCG